MAEQKNKESVANNRVEYEEYFKEDLEAIEEELKKSKEYSQIIDAQISTLSNRSYGDNRGAQHYLIEHIANAVQLQTQRQGLRKDRFAIKKAILDYSAKFADNEGSENQSELLKKIESIIRNDKEKKIETTPDQTNTEDLDKQIDKILEEDN